MKGRMAFHSSAFPLPLLFKDGRDEWMGCFLRCVLCWTDELLLGSLFALSVFAGFWKKKVMVLRITENELTNKMWAKYNTSS